jgi:hypothetical protein
MRLLKYSPMATTEHTDTEIFIDEHQSLTADCPGGSQGFRDSVILKGCFLKVMAQQKSTVR